MARVTVEDCIVHVPNRFELVLMAAQRAKQIASGNPITLPRDNDKDAVVSLREIADETIPLESLREDTINSFCKRHMDTKSVVEQTAGDLDGDDFSQEVEEAIADAAAVPGVDSDEGAEGAAGMSYSDEEIDPED